MYSIPLLWRFTCCQVRSHYNHIEKTGMFRHSWAMIYLWIYDRYSNSCSVCYSMFINKTHCIFCYNVVGSQPKGTMTVTTYSDDSICIKYIIERGTQKVNSIFEIKYFHTYYWERLSNYQRLLLTNVQLWLYISMCCYQWHNWSHDICFSEESN